jgi:hydroxyacid-oxoacid transhydrogenase
MHIDDAVGDFLFEQIARFLDNLGVPRGLKAVGYQNSDIDMLVKGTIPQRRVLDLAPGIGELIRLASPWRAMYLWFVSRRC